MTDIPAETLWNRRERNGKREVCRLTHDHLSDDCQWEVLRGIRVPAFFTFDETSPIGGHIEIAPRVGLSRGAEPETPCRKCGHPEEDHDGTTHAFQGLSPSGDDEELKEALKKLREAGEYTGYSECAQQLNPDKGYGPNIRKGKRDAAEASAAVESLFGRIREERDRAQDYPIADAETWRKAYNEALSRAEKAEAELGRIREELDEAYHTINGLEQDIERYESGENI